MYKPKSLVENGIRIDLRPECNEDDAHEWCKDYWRTNNGSPAMKWMRDSEIDYNAPPDRYGVRKSRKVVFFKFSDDTMAMWFKLSWG